MWKVIQTRWIRDSDQNFSNVIGEYRRKRQAFGELKSNLHSHLEMLTKHWIDEYEEVDVDWDTFTCTVYDAKGAFYRMSYSAEEIQPEPKKPKINLIAELERLLSEHISTHDGGFFNNIACDLYYDLESLVKRVKEGTR